MTTNELAQKAAGYMAEGGLKKSVALDPAMILFLVQILVEIGQATKWCGLTAGQAASLYREPGIRGAIILRGALNKAVAAHPEMKSYRVDARDAILRLGREMDEKSVSAVLA